MLSEIVWPRCAVRGEAQLLHRSGLWAARDAVPTAARALLSSRLRVGLHAGPMVIGEVGTAARATVTALGDTVNLTARLEGAAEPGTTLMS